MAVLLGLCSTKAYGQSADDRLLDEVKELWEKDFQNLDLPTLTLSYVQFVGDILDTKDRYQQREFFSDVQSKLDKIDVSNLTTRNQLEYSILHYESLLHLEQLDLLDQSPSGIELSDAGIFHQPLGRQWYGYLVQHWTSSNLSPEDIQRYGIKEARRIRQAMKKLKFPIDSTRFTKEPAVIEEVFSQYDRSLSESMATHFPDFKGLPDIRFERGTNEALAQVPGYYGSNRLAYNLFDKPFDLSQIPWLYLHEANPGHHFQLNYEGESDVPKYREGMSYSGFREGWAAYVEEIAHGLGLYPTDADRYSQMEWDLIRSVRLILDVGINYEGWTNEAALVEWRKYISTLDDIGRREINRMRRWPAQVLTYKIGAKEFLESRAAQMKAQGDTFSHKDFHTTVLSERSVPVSLIPKIISTRSTSNYE